MIQLLQIPETCLFGEKGMEIPVMNFGAGAKELLHEIRLRASLRPPFVTLKPCEVNGIHYPGIEVLTAKLKKASVVSKAAELLADTMASPCLMVLQFREKFLIAGKNPHPSATETETNGVFLSHWMHPERLSREAQRFLERINRCLNEDGNVEEVYSRLRFAVQDFPLSGLTGGMVFWMLEELKINRPRFCGILKYCAPFRSDIWNSPEDSRFKGMHLHEDDGYLYDLEDLWYSLAMHPKTREFMEKRRYFGGFDLHYRLQEMYTDALEEEILRGEGCLLRQKTHASLEEEGCPWVLTEYLSGIHPGMHCTGVDWTPSERELSGEDLIPVEGTANGEDEKKEDSMTELSGTVFALTGDTVRDEMPEDEGFEEDEEAEFESNYDEVTERADDMAYYMGYDEDDGLAFDMGMSDGYSFSWIMH